jgi:hypothetical protein
MSYEVIEYFVENGEDAFGDQILAVEIIGGEFDNTVFSYGKVEFPDPDEPNLSFTYTVHHSDVDTSNVRFKNAIGDILVEMIEESLKKNETVFAGGI